MYSIDDIDYFDVPITIVSESVMKKLTNMTSIPTIAAINKKNSNH